MNKISCHITDEIGKWDEPYFIDDEYCKRWKEQEELKDQANINKAEELKEMEMQNR